MQYFSEAFGTATHDKMYYTIAKVHQKIYTDLHFAHDGTMYRNIK